MTAPTARAALSTRRALALLTVGVVAINLGRTLFVPDDAHFPLNSAFSLYALAVAYFAGLSAAELGLARSDATSGLRLGGLAFAVISAAVIVGGLIGLLGDDHTDTSAGEMLLRVLFIIPIGTVLMEELLFRSALHGLLKRLLSARNAVIVGSLLFGLWHVFPAIRGGAASPSQVELPQALVVLGTFLATSVAGVGFIWLRERSGSVIAPMLAHLATNSTTFAVSWLASGHV